MDPAWLITDEALALIIHAKGEMDRPDPHGSGSWRVGPVRLLGGSRDSALWRQEAAALRLISTVEAFVDASAEHWCELAHEPAPPDSSFISWPKRKAYFAAKHSLDLAGLNGWQVVDAGVDLRNCLAHGLGNLTHRLVKETELGKKLWRIGVSVGGNRMHPTASTIGVLSAGCVEFVLALEAELVQRL